MIRSILRWLYRGSPVEDALRAHHAWRLKQDRHSAAQGALQSNCYAMSRPCGLTVFALNLRNEDVMEIALINHHEWNLSLAEDTGHDYHGTELCLLTERALKERK